jgi:hypothetical protein
LGENKIKMAKQLEDRLLTREEAFGKLTKMIAEPEIKCIVKCDTILTETTAKKLGDLIIYADLNKEYIKPCIDIHTEAKLVVLTEVLKRYLAKRWN